MTSPNDLAREMREARKQRIAELAADPYHLRRLELIKLMERQKGVLSCGEMEELRGLQRRFNLPCDF